ncbi:hypothetical protein [Streptomyces sp. NBC_00154]|uniref:hypothetical protein n=1 Tax=Streptomyces sp. NBC_00154 TaxID=2975670 RepID=UPI00225686F9|nr:hypothetical protein [Streptomyces sp. NBC_00154]MCX5309579.1 hypothetical protein [Streptomyces sp. NBC_00154]
MLRLQSGDEVALVAPSLPNGDDAVLMAVRPHPPALKVIEAFLTHTGYPRGGVCPRLGKAEQWNAASGAAGLRGCGAAGLRGCGAAGLRGCGAAGLRG